MSDLVDAALAYAARGWPVFPCWPGRKNPATEHGFKDATTDPEQIRAWWSAHPDWNVAIATGGPAADVLDIDVEPGANGFGALSELQAAGLIDGHGPIIRTRSGGLHIYFAGTDQRSSDARDNSPVDFKAAGGYVLAPPSWVEADDRGPAGRYEFITDTPATGTLDWRIVKDTLVPPPPFTQPVREQQALTGDRQLAGNDYAARTTWEDILTPHGWRQVRQIGNVRYWCRPGKTGRGTSASTRDDGGLWVWSTSTAFESDRLYSKFGAYTMLAGFGEDYAAAAAQLRRDGYGEQPPAITFTQPVPDAPGGQEDVPERTSWYPRDLGPVLDGDESGDPKPVYLIRDDGAPLIYRGKINALIGESESGKTWIALAAAAQAMAAGLLVAYLDFEDAPAGITGRLSALGATRAQLEKLFRYIAPDEPLTPLAGIDLAAVLAERPALAVVDGVNAAMSLLGLNLKDNKDVTDFSQRLLRPLKRSGAAVLTVDHVTKNKDDRGSYAIGAQAKRADIDGVSFIVEAIKKFGRGGTGELRLTVSKDRPGHVRAISAGAEYAGTARLVSHDDGSITVSINSPDLRPASEKPPWRPTGFMQRISEYLETCGDAVSMRAIEAVITGKSQHIRKAAERLIAEGYVTTESGPRNATMHLSARPYREASDPETATASHRVPTASPKDGTRSSEWPDDRVPEDGYMPSAYPDRDAVVLTVPEDTQVQPTASPCQACGEYHDGPCFGAAS